MESGVTANFIPKGVAHVAVAKAGEPLRMTFVLLPNFSLIAFSSAKSIGESELFPFGSLRTAE